MTPSRLRPRFQPFTFILLQHKKVLFIIGKYQQSPDLFLTFNFAIYHVTLPSKPLNMSAKRPPLSEDPSSSSKRPRTRSSFPNLPPTPDDLSVADHLPSVERKVPTGPANPGIIRNRDENVLSRLPRDSDALDTFAKLRRDGSLSDEEAFLKFITTYDVSLNTLNQISTKILPVSFSNVKYTDVAPYVWLDPLGKGEDIRKLDTFRSRIPQDIFRKIHIDVNNVVLQYGRMASHDNEEARSRFIASFYSQVVSLFGNAVINKPGGLLDAEFTKRGRIEHHFYALNSISIVFIEIEKIYLFGKGRLDVIAQVLAECAACDYANRKSEHWVPILAILCDGEKFEFLVYDSGSQSVYSSGTAAVVIDQDTKPLLFLSSLKETTEYIFDYFLMAYINGLRSFGHGSELKAAKSKTKKRKSTEKWMDALAKAEYAHLLCREAAELARQERFEEAEETATKGIAELEESVLQVPEVKLQRLTEWDGEVSMKA